jgi:hypothetical protein
MERPEYASSAGDVQATRAANDILGNQNLGSCEVHSRSLAALIGFQIIRNALILIERAHTSALNSRDMHECIAAAAFRRNKAIALVGIEEFYSSDSHLGILYPIV